METIAIVIALGIVGLIASAIIYGVGYLIIATPLMRWLLWALVAILGVKVFLLPVNYLDIWLFGHPDITLESEVRSKAGLSLSTSIIPTPRSSWYTLLAQGTISNQSDRLLLGIAIECRVRKLMFGDNETVYRRIPISVEPGAAGVFAETLANDLTGVTKTGYNALQVPNEHFCRLDRVSFEDVVHG